MDNKEFENADSQNGESDNQDANLDNQQSQDNDDADALKERNKHLFERAKKAEAEAKEAKANLVAAEKQKQKADENQDINRVQKIEEELDNFKLDQIGNYPEEIKKEVKQLAKLNNISYADSLKSDYIQFKISQLKKNEDNDNASLSFSDSGGQIVNSSPTFKGKSLNDLSDDEWAEYKKKIKQ